MELTFETLIIIVVFIVVALVIIIYLTAGMESIFKWVIK